MAAILAKTREVLADGEKLARASELLRNHPDCLVPSFQGVGCDHWRSPWRRDRVTLAIENCGDKKGSYKFGCVADKLAEPESSHAEVEKIEAARVDAMRQHPDCLQPTETGCRRWRSPRSDVAK